MLSKLYKITDLQSAIIITIASFIVFCDGLKNQFIGDDTLQIVNNPVVHSITHLPLFFQGGTFYIGRGIAPLYGVYYRPLMTTVFSIIYSIFGPHPFYFHLVQLLICTASAIILYLFFRLSFNPVVCLFLALIFLVHPINSQIVFALASMQDALFFFFGILAIYLLVKYSSVKSLIAVAVCLFLALLSKETAILFPVIAVIYLLWYDKKRLLPFLYTFALPFGLYLLLKIHAIGLFGPNPANAPLDKLSLGIRILNIPSLIQFYLTKLVFPWKLASGYYWAYTSFSFSHVVIPAIVDIIAASFVIYAGLRIKAKATKSDYYKYLWFCIWALLGLVTTLQIIPLDETASEIWFYFSMAGVLGMIGVLIDTFAPEKESSEDILVYVFIAIVMIFGIRTIIRGPDWSSIFTLARNDVVTSKQDYVAQGIVADYYLTVPNYPEALSYAEESVSIIPSSNSYNAMCSAYYELGQKIEAEKACVLAVEDSPFVQAPLYENASFLVLEYKSHAYAMNFINKGLKLYPTDPLMLEYSALAEYESGHITQAKITISKSVQYGKTSSNNNAYKAITENKNFVFD